jgi:hypothetical protein
VCRMLGGEAEKRSAWGRTVCAARLDVLVVMYMGAVRAAVGAAGAGPGVVVMAVGVSGT